LFADWAITAAERIRAALSMTDQVTTDKAVTQEDSSKASFKDFIFFLQAQFGIQDLKFETRKIYDGLSGKSILPREFISLIVMGHDL
jgi:hypothetical protein